MSLELIPSCPDYAELYYQWRQQTLTQKYNPLDPLTIEDCRKRLGQEGNDLSQIWTCPSFKWFVKVGDNLVGNVSLKNINSRMLSAEIGYGIGEEFQGKKYGFQAVQTLVKKVFCETQLRKLFALVAHNNIPSRKILEKLGFQLEGTLREHYLIQGQPVDECFYGLLRKEVEIFHTS